MHDLMGQCKDLASLASVRRDHRRAREPTQEVFEIIQEKDNGALGRGEAGEKVRSHQILDTIMKVDLIDVAFG